MPGCEREPHEEANGKQGAPASGAAGEDRVRRAALGRYSPRRLRVMTCALLFLVGILVGMTLGLILTPQRLSQRKSPSAPVLGEPTRIVPIEREEGASPPAIAFNTVKKRPNKTPDILEAGGNQVYCFFDVPHASRSAHLTARWRRPGDILADAEAEVVRDHATHLRGYLVLKPPGPVKHFGEGIYELELLVDGEPVVDGSFAMLKGAAELARIPKGMERYRPEIKNLIVSAGDARAQRKRPFVLPAEPSRVKVTFSYAYAVPGTVFIVYWLYEDGLIAQATSEINVQRESGKAEAWFAPKPPAKLPVGKYGVMISLAAGTPPLARTSFWVGRRPRPDELHKPR